MKTIGITTTVPIEVLLAAGYQPVDLNNVFITDPDPGRLVNLAERDGFPLNCCTWIKGIYGVLRSYGIDTVLGVTTGDCSNTIMLLEVLRLKGLKTIPFAYPDQPEPRKVKEALERLAGTLGTTLKEAEHWREELQPCREMAGELDRLTWQENVVSGLENHLWLVSTSDFNQDCLLYRRELEELIQRSRQRPPYPEDELRLAYLGVPPVFAPDFYPYLEAQSARVVFNEVPRQFAMPRPGNNLSEQYARYTYPYSIYGRVKDINQEIERRRVEGVIHYVQAFCHRGIGDIVFRNRIKLPILTLEGNDEFFLSQHLKTRIEAFLDMLARRRKPAGNPGTVPGLRTKY